MRYRLYKNGDIVISKAGNKAIDLRDITMRQFINDYMLQIAKSEWEQKEPNKSIIDDFSMLIEMLKDENEHKRKRATDLGNMNKTYTITPAIIRRIASAAVVQFEQRENNLTFVTLTLPFKIEHHETNRAFTNFIKNLKKNYHLLSYVATYEHTKSGQGHYHCIFDMPFVDIRSVNNAWANAISVNPQNYKSLVRLPAQKNRSVVRNVTRLVKYLVKYMGKLDAVFEAKNYFIDSELLEKSFKEIDSFEFFEIKKQSKAIYEGEFFSVFSTKIQELTNSEYKEVRRLKPKKQRIKQTAIEIK